MPIAAFEAMFVLDEADDLPSASTETARTIRDLIERHPPSGEPLVPLPYAKKLWKEASPAVVSAAPILGLENDVKAKGDAAWPISIQRLPGDRTAFVLSVDAKPPFGAVADGWAWLRDWATALVADDSVRYAIINASGNDDGAPPGLPGAKVLDSPVPPAVAPWFFLGKTQLENASADQRASLETLADSTIDTGWIFVPSPDFATPIPKQFVEEYRAAARAPVEIYQAKLR